MKVWPQDVEETLIAEPEVRSAAVIPVQSPLGGTTLHAYLIPAAGSAGGDLKELIARCNGRLAQHQRVATASWWPEPDFPRTAMLKIRRHLLPPPERAASVELPVVEDDAVAQALRRLTRLEVIRGNNSLNELGVDSLVLVELALELEERTGKAVGEDVLRPDMTVDEVRAVLTDAPETGSLQAFEISTEEREIRRSSDWPYTWGRIFRVLGFPVDILYQMYVTDTIVLGGEHLKALSKCVIFAGTHRSYADLPLVKQALACSGAGSHASRLVVAIAAEGFPKAGLLAQFGILAFGLFPLQRLGEGKGSLRELARIAAHGNPVLIFPQGIHARRDQEISGDPAARFRRGAALLAGALHAPVVPFGLAGPERLIPPTLEGFRGRTIAGIPVSLTRCPLAIAFGPPVAMEADETPPDFTVRLERLSFALTRQAERALEETRAGTEPPAQE
jgi:1-acyl-sn-glycerol-3-phosphate acyltransferase/acyl carrier protein